ncbi:MAG TPA: alpha/beta hydrolase [Chloroflexota bacterium]|nr:alpha/beta hydrolase [Chloroflexota bacterium]
MSGTKYDKTETEHYADVSNHKIHYNDVGKGPALFCFHGGGPGSNAWDNSKHNLDALAEHFRCIIMDMPGYGYSDKDVKRGEEPLDIFCAKIILGLMDHLGIDKAHLYGSSQFSACCLRFGIEYPDRIGKIIIQASGIARTDYFTPGRLHGGKLLAVVAQNPTRENMAALMHEFIPKDELCTDEVIDARLEAALIPGHLAGRAKMPAASNSDLTPIISRLKAPVLGVYGHHDRVVGWESALSALAMIPDVRIHVWGGGTGHFVEYEKAEEFNNLVIGFLNA